MASPQDVGKDATTTSFDGTKSIPKPQRRLYVASLVAVFVVIVVCGYIARGVADVSTQGDARDLFKHLPVAWDPARLLGRLLKDPFWLGVAAFGVVILALLALKGLLDRGLKLLIGLNILLLIVFLLVTLSSFLAVFRASGKPGG